MKLRLKVKVKAYILFLLAAMLISCSTTSLLPSDDVYYWPHTTVSFKASTTKTTPVATSTPVSTSASPETNAKTVEYVNVQDTTVTIRVKK